MRAQSAAGPSDDPDLQRYVEKAIEHASGNVTAAAARLERCLDALEQIDRNANQSTLIEAWLDGLVEG